MTLNAIFQMKMLERALLLTAMVYGITYSDVAPLRYSSSFTAWYAFTEP